MLAMSFLCNNSRAVGYVGFLKQSGETERQGSLLFWEGNLYIFSILRKLSVVLLNYPLYSIIMYVAHKCFSCFVG
jgi:hypothetical protein